MGEQTGSAAGKVLCDLCGKIIGVYEPMVVLVNGELHETSRAAGAVTGLQVAERYHRACHAERLSPSPPAA